jgi:TRAP-type C4-dicarboxylate transport system permease small subunit
LGEHNVDIKRSIEAIAERLVAVQGYTAAVFMIVMTALYGFNVLARTFLPKLAGELAWIDDAARYLMIWVVFLAAGAALEAGRHVLVDLAWRRLGVSAKRLIFALIDMTGLLFSVLMVVLSVQLTIFIAQTGQISATLGLPIYILYIAPVIGFTSLALIFLLRVFGFCDARLKQPDLEPKG